MPGNLDRARGRCTRPASSGSSASCSTPASPEFPPLDDAELRAGADRAGRRRRAADRRTPRTPRDRGAPPRRTGQLRRFLASRPARGRGVGDRPADRGRPDTGARVHVVHLADPDALPMLAGRAGGRRADHRRDLPALPDLRRRGGARRRDAVQVLPADPRGGQPRGAVGRRCADGDVDLVVSDHSPCTPDLKRLDTGDFGAAWGGIASLQLALPAVWTGARARGHRPRPTSSRWMAAAPARLAGLTGKGAHRGRQGRRPGRVRPRRAVDGRRPAHRNPVTPYAGRSLVGAVRRTWLRGRGRRRLPHRPVARAGLGLAALLAGLLEGLRVRVGRRPPGRRCRVRSRPAGAPRSPWRGLRGRHGRAWSWLLRRGRTWTGPGRATVAPRRPTPQEGVR